MDSQRVGMLTALREHWLSHGALPSGSPAKESEVREWEQKNGVRLPNDLRDYVCGLNGMSLTARGEMDDNYFRFVPLVQMEPEIEIDRMGRPGMFLFVDYLQLCYWYCVELDATEKATTRVFLCGTPKSEQARPVAASLAEFFRLYMEEPRALEIRQIEGPQ
jgi:hypothetical protein